MKCPDCTNELEKRMPTFYHCSNCKTMFIIVTQNQFEKIGELQKGLDSKTIEESEHVYRKMMEEDSV